MLQDRVVAPPKKSGAGSGAGAGDDSVSVIIKVINKQEARTMKAWKYVNNTIKSIKNITKNSPKKF